jgi:hypothetical protein
MYDEYSALFCVVGCLNNGKFLSNNTVDALITIPDYPIMIGIDQSTSQTGVFISYLNGTPVACIDVINRSKSIPSDIYARMLSLWLKNQFAGCNVKFVVTEATEDYSRTVYSRTVLAGLKGAINLAINSITELASANHGEILPQTWRKHYLADKCYSGRRAKKELVKESAVEETIKRFPMFNEYLRMTGKGTDSADACGILIGYLEEMYYDKSYRLKRVNVLNKVNNKLQYTHLVISSKLDNSLMVKLKDHFQSLPYYRGIEYWAYNTQLTVIENCKRVSNYSNAVNVIIATDEKSAMLLRWETDDRILDGEHYVLIAFRKSIGSCNTKPLDGQEDFWLNDNKDKDEIANGTHS